MAATMSCCSFHCRAKSVSERRPTMKYCILLYLEWLGYHSAPPPLNEFCLDTVEATIFYNYEMYPVLGTDRQASMTYYILLTLWQTGESFKRSWKRQQRTVTLHTEVTMLWISTCYFENLPSKTLNFCCHYTESITFG